MSEPLHSYSQTIKLPCEKLEAGLSDKAKLDAAIKEMVTVLAKGSGLWQCAWRSDASGNLAATLNTKTCVVDLKTNYGQNAVYVGQERRSFISYGVQAESKITFLEQAADKAEHLRLLLKVIGGVFGPIVLFGLFNLILDLLGFVIIPYVLITISLVVGIWGGRKLGDLLGSAMESRAEQRAETQGVKAEADAFWGMLTMKLDHIIEPYDPV